MATLKQNIDGLNIHNKQVKEYYLSAIQQAQALIGKKIHTAKMEKSKQFNIDLPHIKEQINGAEWIDIHSWFTFSGQSVWLHIKTCYSGGSWDVKPTTAFCIYFNDGLYIGETDNDGKLMRTATEEVQKSWLITLQPVTIEEIKTKEAEYKELQERGKEIFNSVPEHLRKVLYLNR